MPKYDTEFVILAAGFGSRMRFPSTKALMPLAGVPMIQHLLNTVASFSNSRAVIVASSDNMQQMKDALSFKSNTEWVVQHKRKGTGDAVAQTLPVLDSKQIVVLYADSPLISKSTLQKLIDNRPVAGLVLLSAIMDNPKGYGRIIRDGNDEYERIVEENDASDVQKSIKEVNSGVIVVDTEAAIRLVDAITPSLITEETYLTELPTLVLEDDRDVNVMISQDPEECQGANDIEQLAMLEKFVNKRKLKDAMRNGVLISDPDNVKLKGELITGVGCKIGTAVVIEGRVDLGNYVQVDDYVVLKDCSIADNSNIKSHSNIEGASLGTNNVVGPHARLREGTKTGADVKIGNYVETKKAVIGDGSKASHLAYLGDVDIGRECNIGAGVVFVNYDGKNKHTTKVGNKVFVGSNCSIVAPVTLADNSFVAAGSTITKSVPKDGLAVARGKQFVKENWSKNPFSE